MGRSTQGSLPWQLRIHQLFSTDGLLVWARAGRRSSPKPGEVRRFELLERLVAEAVIEQHPTVARPREILERKVVAFRPLWRGIRVNRAAVQGRMRTSEDRNERKTAYYAQEPLARAIEGRLRKLARRRNERARALGFRSYPDYKLGFEGFGVAQLEQLLDELAPLAQAAARAKRDRFQTATGARDWFPWDETFVDEFETPIPPSSFAEEGMVDAVLEGVRAWGFRGKALQFPIDHHDLPSGGIEIPVDPPRDVRIIVHPVADWTHYMILFHEVGHTVQARSNAVHAPLLRWHEYVPGFPGFIEGIGTLFEEIARSPEWLATRPGVPRSVAERTARGRHLSDVAGMASRILQVRTELALYRNPDGDLEAMRHRAYRRLYDYDAFDPTSWAGPFLVRNPMYLQSYVFAGVFSKQLMATMCAELGGTIWPNRRFGPWLTEHWFRPSGEFDWVSHLKAQTGNPFGVGAYARWAKATLASAQDR
jgi:hypothetical protein